MTRDETKNTPTRLRRVKRDYGRGNAGVFPYFLLFWQLLHIHGLGNAETDEIGAYPQRTERKDVSDDVYDIKHRMVVLVFYFIHIL
jgi:hypothetical protein